MRQAGRPAATPGMGVAPDMLTAVGIHRDAAPIGVRSNDVSRSRVCHRVTGCVPGRTCWAVWRMDTAGCRVLTSLFTWRAG